MKKTMPNEMNIKDTQCTLDMYNDRGSNRLCDILIERDSQLISLDLNAGNGTLEIKSKDDIFRLSEYQVKALIEFLSQRD